MLLFMSFHFTQSCAFIAYLFRFYGLLFVFYRGQRYTFFQSYYVMCAIFVVFSIFHLSLLEVVMCRILLSTHHKTHQYMNFVVHRQ